MSILKVCVASLALGLLPMSAGVALADRVVVEPPAPPIFFPRAEFQFDEGGYYRSHDGHYWHYDRDREGWHHGRSHREAMRDEERHHHERERERDHDR